MFFLIRCVSGFGWCSAPSLRSPRASTPRRTRRSPRHHLQRCSRLLRALKPGLSRLQPELPTAVGMRRQLASPSPHSSPNWPAAASRAPHGRARRSHKSCQTFRTLQTCPCRRAGRKTSRERFSRRWRRQRGMNILWRGTRRVLTRRKRRTDHEPRRNHRKLQLSGRLGRSLPLLSNSGARSSRSTKGADRCHKVLAAPARFGSKRTSITVGRGRRSSVSVRTATRISCAASSR